MNAVLKPTITYKRECVLDVLKDIQPLLERHYCEIAHYPDITLNPDYERYAQAERLGMLQIYTARDFETLVGYAIYFVAPALHYKDSIQGIQDILFVLPDYRLGSIAWRLLEFSEKHLSALGVQVVRQHMKAAHSFEPLLARRGYELEDLIYVKRLD